MFEKKRGVLLHSLFLLTIRKRFNRLGRGILRGGETVFGPRKKPCRIWEMRPSGICLI